MSGLLSRNLYPEPSRVAMSAGRLRPRRRNASGVMLMRRKSPVGKYVKQALELGARHAKRIPADTIVTAPWVRMKCQYGCGGYGQRLTCPPHSPRPEETERVIAGYRTALLIHGDDHTDVTSIAARDRAGSLS